MKILRPGVDTGGLPRLSSASLWLSHGKSSQEAMDTVFGAVFMREMCSAQNGHNCHNSERLGFWGVCKWLHFQPMIIRKALRFIG